MKLPIIVWYILSQSNAIYHGTDLIEEIKDSPSDSQELIVDVPIIQFFPEDISKIAEYYIGIHPDIGLFDLEFTDVSDLTKNREKSVLVASHKPQTSVTMHYFDFQKNRNQTSSIKPNLLTGKAALKFAERFRFVRPLILQFDAKIVSFMYNSFACNGNLSAISDLWVRSLFSSSTPKFLVLLPQN